MTEVIQVDFGKPMPLFPLPEAVLLPHAVLPLHVFEPRYRSMIDDCIDESGQIAMASFRGNGWKSEYHGLPKLRPAVCVGQIVQHDSLPDGRHNILLHGICRARITKLIDPNGERPYRMARLRPLEAVENEPPPMTSIRRDLHDLLRRPHLGKMRCLNTVMEWFDRDDVTTHALLELIGFALVQDFELRYRLLAEASPERRALLIKQELSELDKLLTQADHQAHQSWPKGLSWN